jgi:hypothetical protein
MDPRETVEAYYESLRQGDPLAPYFADDETTVKFGISESRWGGDVVAAALREQTSTTTDWVVESEKLTVDHTGETAWFADEVQMSWTDTERRIRYEFDTRWSGTLVDRDGWQFVGMHVSTAGEV